MSRVVTKLERISMPLMMTAAVSRSFVVLATRPIGTPPARGLCSRSFSPPSISGMTVTPVSKPLRPKASFGKHQQGARDQQRKIALRRERGAPVGKQRRVRHDLPGAAPEHDEIESEVRQSGRSRQADCLVESFQEDHGEHGEDRERDEDLVLAEHRMQERILDGMLGGVGCRQRHRDHEVRGRKAEQDQDEQLCPSSPRADSRAWRWSPAQRSCACATWTYTGRAPNSVTATRITVAIGATAPAASSAMPGW